MNAPINKAFTGFNEDGVLVVTLDLPGEKVSTLGRGMIGELFHAA